MNRAVFTLLVSIITTACATAGDRAPLSNAPESGPHPRNIILIGWDGAQRNHVKECLGRNELPNLKRLSEEGSLVAVDIERVTDTKAGWTQILTGYEPEITGVYSNARYLPIPEGYTIFERLEKHFGRDNIATVAVIGKKGHVDDDPPQRVAVQNQNTPKQRKNAPQARKQQQAAANKKRPAEGQIVKEGGIQYRLVPGKPYYNTSKNMDLFINGLQTNDKVGSKTLALLDQYKDKPFFFFVHFAEVDHDGHRFGENSKEYNDALISSDFWTGKIADKLKALGLYGQTLIYVTADHGFDEGRNAHQDAPYVFLASNDPKIIRNGDRVDIAPTILDRFGLDLASIKPPLDGHPLTKPYSAPKW